MSPGCKTLASDLPPAGAAGYVLRPLHAGFSGPIGIIGLVAQGDHTTFKETRAFLVELRAQARQAFGSGKTVEQASAEIKLPDYAGWQGVADLSMPLRRLYAEFRGEL